MEMRVLCAASRKRRHGSEMTKSNTQCFTGVPSVHVLPERPKPTPETTHGGRTDPLLPPWWGMARARHVRSRAYVHRSSALLCGGCAPARQLVHEPCERQQPYGVAGCQDANSSHPPQRVTISAFGMKSRIRRQPTSRSLAFVVPRSDEGQPPTMNCGLRKTALADVLGEED
jgi:hypothetical protein